MKLLIISHTQHYLDSDGIIRGWGPTVREINYLSLKFDEIIHIGCLHGGSSPASCISYSSSKITFIPLPPAGGKSMWSKIRSFIWAPKVICKINKYLKNADAVQLRIPTGMANYLLPFLTFKRNKPLVWVKYAGNWNQKNAPIGYRFQRWWLKSNFLKSKVTINGSWNDQPRHCYTFENPCLDEEERIVGEQVVSHKKYSPPYSACFIGRIEPAKGIQRIMDALPVFASKKITTIHFIGEGEDRAFFEQVASKQHEVKCIFHGSMKRNAIPEILSSSHLLLLPSIASEGFPKVIAEGGNYGVIPVVSNISSIGQYINNTNGFVWNIETSFSEWLSNLNLDEVNLLSKGRYAYQFAGEFTFQKYYDKLMKNIFNDN